MSNSTKLNSYKATTKHANPANTSNRPKLQTWLSVYRLFVSIGNTVLDLPEGADYESYLTITQDLVEALYAQHEGDPAWDLAYQRYVEPSEDDLIVEVNT